MTRVIDMVERDTVEMTPEEFIRMRSECPDEIKSAKIVPPVLGRSNDFGKISVKLTKKRYEVSF